MKPTLAQVFALSLLGLLAVLALLFFQVFAATRRTLEESSDRLRAAVSERIGERVTRFLAQGPAAAQQVQLALHRGLTDPRDPVALEAALLAPLLADRDLGEITLTYGRQTGFDAEGMIVLAPGPRGQISVVRTLEADGSEHFWSRHVHAEGAAFVADRRDFGPVERFAGQPLVREADTRLPDPTEHPTFTTPARRVFYGRLLWSDLHWSQLDAELPPERRRVEVSVQQVMTDAAAQFAGVLRVGLLARQLDRAVRLDSAADPHLISLCDDAGRLVTRGAAGDRLVETDDDLRLDSAGLPPVIAAALADPALGRSAAAGAAFTFRLLDVVAVKGKQHAVRIYELLGEQGTARPAAAGTYERAFALYLARDFSAASALLAPLTDDPPSRLLLARCRDFLRTPPGPAWNGTHIAAEK